MSAQFTLTFAQAKGIVTSFTEGANAVAAKVKRAFEYADVKQADFVKGIYAAYDAKGEAVPTGFRLSTLKNAHTSAVLLAKQELTPAHPRFADAAVAMVTIVRAPSAAGGGVPAATSAGALAGSDVDVLVAEAAKVTATANENRRAKTDTRGPAKVTGAEKGAKDGESDGDTEGESAPAKPSTITLADISTARLIHEITARLATGGAKAVDEETYGLFAHMVEAFNRAVAAPSKAGKAAKAA